MMDFLVGAVFGVLLSGLCISFIVYDARRMPRDRKRNWWEAD